MALELITIDSSVLYDNIIQSMEIACGQPLYPGDERRIFAEAVVQVAVSLANACNAACNNKMLAFATGDALDALGDRFGVERLEPTAATGIFRFTLTEVQPEDVTIPAGTQVTTNGDIYFATNEEAVIAAGDLTVDVECSCTTAGTVGNDYIIGSVAQIVDLITYVKSAVNITQTAGGSDEETDDELRERIRLSNSKYSTAGPVKAYQYWAKSADGSIIDAAIMSPSAGEVVIYPLCEGGSLPSAQVLQAVADVCSADDVRPLTDHVTVQSPTAVDYDIEVKYYTTADNEQECIDTIEGDGGAIELFKEWQSGALGRDLNPDKLRALCLSPEEGTGCIRIDVISPTRTEISSTEVARFNSLTVSHEVVTE